MSEDTQRRLAAIVSADVVGYSRLMGANEIGTLSDLKKHRSELIDPLIEKHGGRIVKTTGDGLLLEFPSVVAAVECSIAVQDGMAARNTALSEDAAIQFRVGVHLGDVIVEGDDIFGDGVNVAARLESLSEPNGLALSDDAYRQVRDRIDVDWHDGGEHEVKNIARPVHVWRWSAQKNRRERTAEIIGEALALPDKPSIAVLPFDNMSGDPEQEYFADGMTEDLITELSRFEDLFVIARNSTFTYKGKRPDVRDVARELGVGFVLEGSVRKAGQRVRITAQLVRGQDGGHVWAERYDGALDDIFDLQEQVTSEVVGSIAPEIAKAETERLGRGERVFDDAHDIAWRARERARDSVSQGDPAGLEQAIEMAAKALEINPRCAVAYQVICHSYTLQNLLRWGDAPSTSASLAEQWATKFRLQLPGSYAAFQELGLAKWRNGQYQDALRDLRFAHELNPNDTRVLQYLAMVEAAAGNAENAKSRAQTAIRLSPKDINISVAYLALAMAAFIENDDDNFEEWAEKAVQGNPTAPIRRALIVAYAARTGNQPLLERHRAALMRSTPDFIDSLFRRENQIFQRPEHVAMLLDGLRLAGSSE